MEPDSTERDDEVAINEVNEEWVYVEEQQVDEQQKNRRIGARMGCATAARWDARKTLETENATKGEHPEE